MSYKEAVITIVIPAQGDEPACTEVHRIEFEGLLTFGVETKIIAHEKLTAEGQ